MSLPVNPLQEARTGAETRTQRLIMGLNVMSALTVLLPLLWLLGGFWAWKVISPAVADVWPEIIKEYPGLTDLSVLGWPVLGLVALMIGTTVWMYQVFRQGVATLREQLFSPNPANAAAFVRAAQSVRPWITLGQWFPVIMLLINLATSVLMWGGLYAWSSSQEGGGSDLQVELTTMLPQMLIGAIYPLASAILTWLLLASVKRWLDALVSRTQGEAVSIMPAAQSMSNWLILALAFMCLQAVSLLVLTLFTLLGPLVIQMFLSDSDIPAQWQSFAKQGGLLVGLLLLGQSAMHILTIACIAWLRGLGENVATLLDGPLQAATPQDHSLADW